MITKDIVNDIRAEIAAKIASDADDEVIGAVYAYPKSTLNKFPGVVVMPSENSADYGSTATDRLTFAFNLNIYFPIQKEAEYEGAELAIGQAVGEMLRIFSAKNALATVDWVEPVPSVWGEATVGEAVFRTAQVILRCVKYVDTV